MNLSRFSIGEKLILLGGIIALISLFLPWVDVSFYSENGFQQQGFLVLVVYIYPVLKILTAKAQNKVSNIICMVVGLAFMLYFVSSKSISVFGSSYSAASIGMYVMIVGLIVSLVGAILSKKQG